MILQKQQNISKEHIMENKELEALKEELKGASDKVKDLVTKQSEEIKKFGETHAKTAAQLAEAEKKLEQAEADRKGMVERMDKLEAKGNRLALAGGNAERKATPGMRFAMSEEYKHAVKAGLKSTSSVEVGNIFSLKQIEPTVGDNDDADRAPVWPDQIPEIFFDPGQRMLTLRDLMNVGQTQSNSVEYFMETEFNPSGAASQEAEGETKTKQKMQFAKKNAPVETIAAWLPVSRQVIEDQAMLQSHIDSRLIYAVNKELEDQILFGDGQSGNLLGIHSTPGVETIGAPTGGDTAIDHIRKAIAVVRSSEYAATGIIIHPNDWASIELQKGSDNHYIWVSVPDGGASRLWRVPVIETTAMQEGRFLSGSFGLGAQLWDRMASTIRISENVNDYFVRNLIAVLAELRVALTVYRPGAFVKGVFDETLST
jgi:HK97 family phage major capsid protein